MRVYLDHNATTPLRREARERWLEVVDALGGNASGLHAGGRRARDVVDDARERVARALAVAESEIVFTSGGTESNNLALQGGIAGTDPDDALVTTAVEHSSVLDTAGALSRAGRRLFVVPVDPTGLPALDVLADAIASGCSLISVMAANNETGAVPDLAEVHGLLSGSERRPIFHTDAVQALGRLPLELRGWGVDLASFSAHKLGGPPGVGVLYRRKGTPLEPLFFGGGQEDGLRPGTEDVAGIAAAAVAIEHAVREQKEYAARAEELVRETWEALASSIGDIELLGPALEAARLPNTLCVRLPNTDGKVLVTRLDLEGVEVSAGSACASGSLEPSHVLRAMGFDDDAARSGLRLSLGPTTSREECKHVVDVLRKVARASRAT